MVACRLLTAVVVLSGLFNTTVVLLVDVLFEFMAVCGGTVGLVMFARKPVTVIPDDDNFNIKFSVANNSISMK